MQSFFQTISYYTRNNAFFALVIGFFLYSLCFLLLVNGFMLVLQGVSGMTLQQSIDLLLDSQESQGAAAWMFRAIQGGNQLLGYGLSAMLLAALLGGPAEGLQFRLTPGISRSFSYAILIIVFAVPLVSAILLQPEWLSAVGFPGSLVDTIKEQEELNADLLKALFVGPGIVGLLANLFVFALLPAFCEEAFFRGFLQRQFGRMMNPHLAVWLTAAIFSLIHFQFLGFFSRMVLGGMLGYFMFYSRSIWPSVIAHFAFNAVSVIGAWLYPRLAEADYQFSWIPVLISAFSVSYLGYRFYRDSTENTSTHEF